MSFLDIHLKIEYRTKIDDVKNDFYIPVLKNAISYKRAVGFFSSTILVDISEGIDQLIKNGGNIKIIASPKLSREDIDSISKGYSVKEIIKNSAIKELYEPINDYEEERLNYLANLIANNRLDIKLTVTLDGDNVGMYHEKMGILQDADGNKIAFSGSNNETHSGVLLNYETIDVFLGHSGKDSSDRVKAKENAFDSIWADTGKGLKTYHFTEIAKELIDRYKKSDIDLDNYDFVKNKEKFESKFFKLPQNVNLYEYQKNAIKAWQDNNFLGVFDMATGSGKTFTALGALCKLSQFTKDKLAVVIVVPYIHLVEQWCEDIENFNVSPIKAYGGTRWQKDIDLAIKLYNATSKGFCVITTYATFVTDDFQKAIANIKKDYCFVADEAHNAGSPKVKDLLPKKAKYRLGLSATVDRHNDEIGTQAIYDYFGAVCINFTLKDAIRLGFLTEYYYYPIVVYLNEDELGEYNKLSKSISKLSKGAKDKTDSKIQDNLKKLLLKRARIISGCAEKLPALLKAIDEYKNKSHILVYCGATKYDSKANSGDIKQIEAVVKALAFEKGMKVRKFTSAESKQERIEIKNEFSNGDFLQAIVAIKCLDEGVNIPSIKTAFILASSTNPKEYIQRRGRVLRKFKDKKYAEIFDFITLPRRLSEISSTPLEDMQYDLSLVKREYQRMKEFASASLNPIAVDSLMHRIENVYENVKEDTLYE